VDPAGKIALVAGGNGNLGTAIVATLRARGVNVAVVDIEPATAPSADEKTLTVQADIADDASAGAAVAEVVAAFGRIDILVNAAGFIHSEALVNLFAPAHRRHAIETWERVLRANLSATFVLTSHVAEHMAAKRIKGVIVNFSSVASGGNPGQSAYAAAKAGIEALTCVWARELGSFGIRAVAIAPGFVDTPSTARSLNEAAIKEWKRRTPLHRLASAGEITSAVMFAIENDFLTGQTLRIDGGLTI
jgi:3-oxoacyl-[acyl-carrier protein] reductase